ncbi:Carboxy-cis,cis-muconate cyclase [Lecanosticta acicola]|uniref:Carboxy-cis,cis-muconate cyclase n=1 Tax=Lecanosticta acicola TaxID=111012 RepID=A0AAI9ED32_9PEZI|nr:Carboxy-cis,cis-muconate cyclase [Lecanosticta acicola]
MRTNTGLSALLAATSVRAAVHELIVGTFGTTALYTLAFDDVTEELSLVKNTTTNAASSWISFSHDKKTLYGTSFKAASTSYVSYNVVNATTLVPNNKTLTADNSTVSAIYVAAANKPPYNVYGVSFGSTSGPGLVMSVDQLGGLDKVVQSYNYSNDSAVHGLAIGADGSFLYSADDTGNKIWTHAVDPATGELTLVDSLEAPETGSDPRHVAAHPSGQYLYAVMEGKSKIAQYSIDQTTGKPVYCNISFPLLPSGSNSSLYWADEVMLSKSSNLLWATNRARTTSSKGYISAFSLTADGAIEKQLFLTETTTSGGSANAVTPSGFSDEYVALTDSSVGFVDVWKLAANRSTASVVSRVMLEDGECCANAIWYS